MKIVLVAGARPNFMKIAPIYAAMQKFTELEPYILHTGQHYDHALSESFFEDLALPPPSFHLGVGSGTAGEQIGRIIIACEQTFYEQSPDLVIVVGDVNSTLACALVAQKQSIALAHVEAGLRSFDRTMPEEINRVLTDQISDYLFTTESVARKNLLREGIPDERIFLSAM